MARVQMSGPKILEVALASPGYWQYADERAEELRVTAVAVFNSKQLLFNEHRLSETTPPKYVESFEVKRRGFTLVLVNTDPAAMWVEWGAHAGGRTAVLRYKPMTQALEIVGNRGAD